MKADIRYYFLIVKETDAGIETIYVNTERLIAKTKRKYPDTVVLMETIPGTVVLIDNIPLPTDYIDTTWFFCNNEQINDKKPTITQNLRRLTNQSELVIRGHGDVKNNKVSRVSAPVLARALVNLGFGADCRINITGCNLGRNPNIANGDRAVATATNIGTGSFAQLFQAELFKLGRRNVVHARTSPVTVAEDGSKKTFDFALEEAAIAKQRHSKIIFSVDGGGAQTMEFAY